MVLFRLQVKNGQTLQRELLAKKPKLEEIVLTVAIVCHRYEDWQF